MTSLQEVKITSVRFITTKHLVTIITLKVSGGQEILMTLLFENFFFPSNMIEWNNDRLG